MSSDETVISSGETLSTTNESKANIKAVVREWIRLYREIKAMTKKRTELGAFLAPLMKKTQVESYNLRDEKTKMKHSVRNYKTNISKKFLMDTMNKFFENNPDVAKEAVEFILNSRETKTRSVLIDQPVA